MAGVPQSGSRLAPNGQGTAQLSPSAGQGQPKRSNRSKKTHPQSVNHVDGTVSDSVTDLTASPRPKRQPNKQGVAAGVVSDSNGGTGVANGHKRRPASLGGQMLPTTPAKEKAYAGPTFHASPAPSSLPVPKFFSRSVPNVAGNPPLQACIERDDKTPDTEGSPGPDVVAPVSRDAHQSPLDLFFQADKAEKEKSRSNSMLSPEMAARKPPMTEPRNASPFSSKSLFKEELDGHGRDRPSLNAVPGGHHSSPDGTVPSSDMRRPSLLDGDEQREASTRSLKELLFNNVTSFTPPPSSTPPRGQTAAHADANVFNTPPPFQRSASGPSTPTPLHEQPNNYSLHYGNRNLSPLFKAARSETPTKPSGLRREMPSARADFSPQPPRQPSHIDPNEFSRDYLHQQIRDQPAAPLSQFPSTEGSASSSGAQAAPYSYSHSSSSGPSATSQQGVQAGAEEGPSRDVRSMEDDLRRMLKLNVLG